MAGLHYTGSEIGIDRSEAQAISNPPPPWLATVGLIAVYFLAGKAGLFFASVQPNASAVWPPTGIALAACLLFGYRVWPGIFLGAFLVNATTAGSIASSLGIAVGNTLEALTGAYLVNRFANGANVFNRPRDVLNFTLLAAGASTALSATIGVTSLSLGGYASWSHFGQVWFTWWLGDAAGALIFAPLLLSWWVNPRLDWERAQLCEAGLLLVSLAMVAGLVFGNVLPTDIQHRPIAFACIPFLIWAAFRFGPREAATASFVLTAIAIIGTLRGFGPFAWIVPNDALLLLLGFLGVLGLTAITIAAGVEQRRGAEKARADLAAIVDSSGDAIIGKTLDGRITSWNASGASGRIVGASSTARDISEHKRVMEALRASEERFHQMAETVPDILFTTDADGAAEYTNQRFYEYTGISQATAGRLGWIAALHPDDAQRARERWQRLVRSGQPFQNEFRLRAADGSYRWFMAQARPIRDGQGHIIRWFGSCPEIEEHKRAQQEREKLLHAEQIARAEAEAAATKLRRLQSVTDSTLPELTLDQMLRELLARLRSAIGADTATVLLLEPGSQELAPVASVGFEEEIEAGIRVRLGSGIAGRIATSNSGMIYNDVGTAEVTNSLIRRRLSSLVGAPLKIEDNVIGVIHVGSVAPREFTEEHLDLIRLVAHRAALAIERTRLHENERAAHAAAEEANRAKDEFLAMLGHELRNPLGAILSSMEVLGHFGEDARRAANAHERMGRQLKHLARLVDDLLDVSRLTRGKIELRRQPLHLAENVKACLNALEDRLSSHDVKVEIEPVWVNADPTRLEQIITNLLHNAIEYTPHGGQIRVSVRAEEGNAVIRVEDRGAGISPELLPRIFDLFVQDKQGLDRPGGGLGIGLTLTRRLVELHEGTIDAVSPGPGAGSVFTVRLPRLTAQPPTPQVRHIPIRANVSRRILIVEDNADARESLHAILELSGHEVHEAGDGPGGIEQALALKPQVALIDIGLPGVDGYEVARQIRSAPAGRRIFLIALTGYGQPRDRQQAHEAGFDAHLVKPVDFERLSEIIAAAPDWPQARARQA